MTDPSRRRFLWGGLGLAGLGLLPGCGFLPPGSQPPARVPRIGILGNYPSRYWDAFSDGLGDLGYMGGQSISFEARWSEGINDRFPGLAAELVDLEVDIVAVSSPGALRAARAATGTIPILMIGATNDPVADGAAASLARPGWNVTGLTFEPPEVPSKRLELLKGAAPGAARVGALAPSPTLSRQTQEMARALGVELIVAPISTPADLDGAFAAIAGGRSEALLAGPVPLLNLHPARILEFAAQRGLPAMYPFREFVEDGGLMFYGTNLPDLYRRAATLADKILKGARPADLPIQQPTRFDLVVNLRNARALGLTMPESVLAQMTEVIQ